MAQKTRIPARHGLPDYTSGEMVGVSEALQQRGLLEVEVRVFLCHVVRTSTAEGVEFLRQAVIGREDLFAARAA